MAQKVVAHFVDHTIVKGVSMDVDPGKPLCHVRTDAPKAVEVDLRQVKALYFVRDLNGNPTYDETHHPEEFDSRLHGSTLLDITFVDGERLGALTNRYPPRGPFFFVVPADAKSNNLRILVNRGAVKSMAPRPDPAAARRSKQPT
jgi:hypothetical protein